MLKMLKNNNNVLLIEVHLKHDARLYHYVDKM